MTDNLTKNEEKGFRDRFASAADDAGRKVHEEANAVADEMTDRAGAQVQTAADAARAAGEEFGSGSTQARVADDLAAQLQGVAGALRDTDLNQAASHVSRFARENPALFLGGAALLGFAAARFLKSSAPESAQAASTMAEPDPWTGHVRGAGAAQSNGRADA